MPDIPTLLLKTFTSPVELRTPRLLLRQWKDSDIDTWVVMNADTEVRRYFPSVQARDVAVAELDRIRAGLSQRGWGMWALEVPAVDAFVGFVGINPPAFPAPWQPAVEIGWRLKRDAWGRGYATEAAAASLQFAFRQLELPQVIALSVRPNAPSHKVMERIGMTPWSGMEFDHPRVPADWPLKEHIVHRITRHAWLRRHA